MKDSTSGHRMMKICLLLLLPPLLSVVNVSAYKGYGVCCDHDKQNTQNMGWVQKYRTTHLMKGYYDYSQCFHSCGNSHYDHHNDPHKNWDHVMVTCKSFGHELKNARGDPISCLKKLSLTAVSGKELLDGGYVDPKGPPFTRMISCNSSDYAI